MAIIRKSLSEIDKMRKSGLLVYQILSELSKMVKEGVTTMELEIVADRLIRDAGAKPAFKGYYSEAAGTKFPYSLCTSVNEVVVHGMPSSKRQLRKGDIVSLDTGLQLNGYFGDSAVTVAVGEIPATTQKLLAVTKEALELAIQQAQPGNRLFDISRTVEEYVLRNGFTVVREFVGHGIGTKLHEEPQVPNYVDRQQENPKLKEGMVIAIEPMVNQGQPETNVLSDKWTAVATDGKPSAHFEHVVAITADGPWVLTRP